MLACSLALRDLCSNVSLQNSSRRSVDPGGEQLQAEHACVLATYVELPACCLHMALQVEAEVVECACVLELPELKGVEKLGGLPLYVQVQKAGL